eukprot:2368459-Alexandrium_andersonii.AAC.1
MSTHCPPPAAGPTPPLGVQRKFDRGHTQVPAPTVLKFWIRPDCKEKCVQCHRRRGAVKCGHNDAAAKLDRV